MSPCGYAVDYLRSAYRTFMSFYPDRPDVVHPVQWYKVPKDRPFLPVPSCFVSSNWDFDNDLFTFLARGQVGLGEVLGAERQWVNGKDPNRTVWVEGQYQGTEAQWAGNGDREPPPPPPSWVPVPMDCCGHAPLPPRCGQVFFPNNGPPFFTVGIGPLTPNAPPFFHYPNIPAGPQRLTWLGLAAPCTWTRQPAIPPPAGDPQGQEVDMVLLVSTTSINLLFISQPPTATFALYGAALPRDWDGFTPVTLIKDDSSVPVYTWPLRITLAGSM